MKIARVRILEGHLEGHLEGRGRMGAILVNFGCIFQVFGKFSRIRR